MELKNGIETKLMSNLPTSQKCVLAKNVFFSSEKLVRLPQKEEVILNWLISTLLKKFSPVSSAIHEGDELWILLSDLSKSANFGLTYAVACKGRHWDMLHCIVDYSCSLNTCSAPKEWLLENLKSNKHLKSFMYSNQEELNAFTAKCVNHDFVLDEILTFYSSAIHFKPSFGANFHDVLLPSLLTSNAADKKIVKLIDTSVFRKNAHNWELFLRTSMEVEDDSKPKSNEMLERLLNKIASMSPKEQVKAIKMLFVAAMQSSISDQCKALLFCVCCDMIQLSPSAEDSLKVSSLASTLILPKINLEMKTKLLCLSELVQTTIECKLDVTTTLVKDVSWMKYLQHLTKTLLDNTQDSKQEEAIMIAMALADYSPSVIEPLVGTLVVAVMSNVDLQDEHMGKLMSLFQKLRQLPKLVARLLITVSKNKLKLQWTPNTLSKFADNVVKLPVGQLLELWKTFDFHMKNGNEFVTPSVDVLMSTFISNSRLIEQSIPDITAEKVLSLVKNSLEVASKTKEYPLVREALAEMSLILMKNRNFVIEPSSFSMNPIQKRKLHSFKPDTCKKIRIDWKDISQSPPGLMKTFLEEMTLPELRQNINDILKLVDQEIIEEEERLLTLILDHTIDRWNEQAQSDFLRNLTNSSIEKASEQFEFLPIEDEYASTFAKMPLEHLQGDLEAKISLISLSVVNSNSALLERCLCPTFRSCTILKYVSISKIVPILEKCKEDKILPYVLKLAVTYQKPFGELIDMSDEFLTALQSYSDPYLVRVSIQVLEALLPTLSSTNEERKYKCQTLFKSLSKGFIKGVSNSNEIEDRLTINALSTILIHSKHDDTSAKKWKKLTSLVQSYLCHSSINMKFAHVVLDCLDLFENPKDILNTLIDTKIHLNPITNAEESKFLQLIVQVSAQNDIEMLKKVLGDLLEATYENTDLSINWKHISEIKSLPSDEAFVERRQALAMLTSKMLTLAAKDQKPILELYQALLEQDKPVIFKETEALCLCHAVQIELWTFLKKQDSEFVQHWHSVYKILSTAFHKRPSAVVVPRIPMVLRGMRSLMQSLAYASDQKRNLSPTQVKELVTLAHYFDRLCDHVRKLKEEFARVVPYFIGDIMDAFQKHTIYPRVRSNLLHGVHKLLDTIDTHSIEYLSSVLPPGQQEMFKHEYSNYKHYHRYSGKV